MPIKFILSLAIVSAVTPMVFITGFQGKRHPSPSSLSGTTVRSANADRSESAKQASSDNIGDVSKGVDVAPIPSASSSGNISPDPKPYSVRGVGGSDDKLEFEEDE